jgi:hypothetical protein
MLHLWSEMLARRRRRFIASVLSVCGGIAWCVALALIGLASGNGLERANAQDLPEAPGTALINPVQVTLVLPARTPEPQLPTTAPPVEPPVPTAAPSIPAPENSPEPLPQPPVPVDTPPPSVPTIPPMDAPKPAPPPAIEPSPSPDQLTATPVAPAPRSTSAPARTRAVLATRTRPSPTAPVASLEPSAPAPTASQVAPTVASSPVTATPQAVAAAPFEPPLVDAPPAPIVEAPEAAPPPPSLETANVVYASSLRRIDARRYAISACLANIGIGRAAGIELDIDVRQRGARVIEVRSERAAVTIVGARAQIRPEPIDANGTRQVDLVVESELPLTERTVAVAATQARWLAGRVQIACAPFSNAPTSISDNRAPRFTLDGALLAPDDAARVLRVTASQNSPALQAAWVLSSASWASLMLAVGSAMLAAALALWFVERP